VKKENEKIEEKIAVKNETDLYQQIWEEYLLVRADISKKSMDKIDKTPIGVSSGILIE